MSKLHVAPVRINPNPRLVWLVNYAIETIVPKLPDNNEYSPWLEWASSWVGGQHSPGHCVGIAHKCFAHKERLVWPVLGQIAWGAKEACYDTPKSGWLVIRYIADAMIAFDCAFPGVDTFIAPPIAGLVEHLK